VEDILEELQHDVESVLLITACDREFEVDVNGELIFSKKLLGRHGNDGEIIKLIKDKM
jgi:predicted Rdx family selenoprotein